MPLLTHLLLDPFEFQIWWLLPRKQLLGTGGKRESPGPPRGGGLTSHLLSTFCTFPLPLSPNLLQLICKIGGYIFKELTLFSNFKIYLYSTCLKW